MVYCFADIDNFVGILYKIIAVADLGLPCLMLIGWLYLHCHFSGFPLRADPDKVCELVPPMSGEEPS